MRTELKEVDGIDWGDAAVMNCRWRGPRLRDVLMAAGVNDVESGKDHVAFACHQQETQEDSWYGGSVELEMGMSVDREVILALEVWHPLSLELASKYERGLILFLRGTLSRYRPTMAFRSVSSARESLVLDQSNGLIASQCKLLSQQITIRNETIRSFLKKSRVMTRQRNIGIRFQRYRICLLIQ